MKHLFFAVHTFAFLFSFTGIFLTTLVYYKSKLEVVKDYLFCLTALTIILMEQAVTSYMNVNEIKAADIQIILRIISSVGCGLTIFYLPKFCHSFFEKKMNKNIKGVFWVLGNIPVVTIVLYYTLPWKAISIAVANLALITSVGYTITMGFKLQSGISEERRQILKAFLVMSSAFLPFLVLDIWIEKLPVIGQYFPFGILSMPLFYIAWNSMSIYFGIRRFSDFLFKTASNSSNNEPKEKVLEESEPSISQESMYEQFRITARERDVINLILKGYSYNRISDELVISLATTKSHIYNIYQKMGVKNKVELINLMNGR